MACAGLVVTATTGSRIALAERPVLAGEATFGVAGGDVLVHYATTGVDVVPASDVNVDGIPDFVAEVASEAERALDHYASLGFRRPLSDGTLGGDSRVDVYLRDLNAADGNAETDSCTAGQCIGFVVTENDYAGFAYPSVGEGIRSVVPHELFHLVQYAYAADQPATWTEGTAVWSVEHLYRDQNSDFERFLPAFLTRTYRPFERSVGGFGDGYPYGAALWPYFLELRFGADAVVAAWTASEQSLFLDAADSVLVSRGSSLEAAWIEFTRWNAFTGSRASGGLYPNAIAWSEAPREAAIETTATIHLEGLAARYVPLALAARSRIDVAQPAGIRIAAWLVEDGQALADGFELEAEGAMFVTTVEAGAYTLVLSGLSRGTLTTAVEIAVSEPRDDTGGCSSTSPSSGALWLVAALIVRRRTRKAQS